jgi:D-alanyl-D-alanine carboxypeptidase/D-alanyl-D-alanine-endopeptidase (penicillin-binding protein 4)
LRTIISHTLRWSDNFMAEQMLSIEGMSAVAATAGAAGASGSATDGSGLSLSDRRTAHGEVALLKAAHNGPAAAALLASLPVACSTGTLEHEMCHTSAAGKVFAKTGTLAHTKALAGYTTDAQGRLVSFAFLTGGDVSTSKAMNAIERSVILLRHYAG